MTTIFRQSDYAIENGLDWDTSIYMGEIVTVAEFEDYAAAEEYFNENELDPEVYGIG